MIDGSTTCMQVCAGCHRRRLRRPLMWRVVARTHKKWLSRNVEMVWKRLALCVRFRNAGLTEMAFIQWLETRCLRISMIARDDNNESTKQCKPQSSAREKVGCSGWVVSDTQQDGVRRYDTYRGGRDARRKTRRRGSVYFSELFLRLGVCLPGGCAAGCCAARVWGPCGGEGKEMKRTL